MAEISTQTKPGRKGFSKNKITHQSTRVDLTPMVDLGFLLITFFVFTSALSEKKAMAISGPSDKGETNVKESTTTTLLLSDNHNIFYYSGNFEKNKVQKSNFREIRSVIVGKKKTTNPDFLMYIIKASAESTFGDNINIIDEMSVCNIKQGHYAEADISKDESEFLKEFR